jgi:hypothetical protein
MNNRPLVYLVSVTCLIAFLLAAITMLAPKPGSTKSEFIGYNDVRGSAIVHNGQPFTLNFEQQNSLISSVNSATNDTSTKTDSSLPYGPIIIYAFDLPNIEIAALGYADNDLVFSTPSWNEGKPLREHSGGELKVLLKNAYDP